MVDSIFTGAASYGETEDSPRVVEQKLNKIFSDLYSLFPGLNTQQTIKMTVSSTDGTVDSPAVTQGKLNAMLADLYNAGGLGAAPQIILSHKNGRAGGIDERNARAINAAAAAIANEPALGALALSVLTGTQGTAYTGNITGYAPGSALSATGLPAGVTLDAANHRLTGTPTVNGTFTVSVTETLAGYRGSPKTTQFTLTVAQPALKALGLSPLNGTNGTAYTGTITNASTGSTLTASGLPAGVTINSAGRTLGGTPTASGTFNITITETLAGYSGSPKANNFTLTIA